MGSVTFSKRELRTALEKKQSSNRKLQVNSEYETTFKLFVGISAKEAFLSWRLLVGT